MNLFLPNLFLALLVEVSPHGKPWEKLAGIKTLKCSFVEIVYGQTSIDTFNGVIYFKSPDRLKMETRNYAVYFIGNKSILYDKKQKQITQETEASVNLDWIFKIDTLFEYSQTPHRYILRPKDKISGVDSVYYVPGERGFPAEFVFFGKFSKFWFRFYDVKFDMILPDSLFVIPHNQGNQ